MINIPSNAAGGAASVRFTTQSEIKSVAKIK
jgi:hypothetical protein